ncbi:hypothetical protein BRARA_D01880 [Brassica rapa]|uniref:F-box domain-containing protein n=1 Tax=Brassica campestris TaxID=3711 RepID=A0A397ZQY9_BRACM|nr:hypothetical protein BRARA_D01880 [Brassica rapa]
MKSRRRNVSEGHNTILQCHSRTCTEEYSETIPHDLIIEIVSRLPTKSVARCRCVSKLWSSLLGRKTAAMVWEICNPSTGQSVILPKMKSRKRTGATSFFGYDPTEKQFKVLSMFITKNGISNEHQVLTLAPTGKLSVRIIECSIPHCPQSPGICINGVLYYKSSPNWSSEVDGIMCFDVRSETFRFVRVMEPFIRAVHPRATLINYNGKLASVMSTQSYNYIDEKSIGFVMYVVQDLEKQKWSKHNYELTHLREYGVAMLLFAGVTVAGEIVLLPKYPSSPFYVFYCSLERKSIRRVEIQGMGGFKQVYTFVNHVEDVKLMQTF